MYTRLTSVFLITHSPKFLLKQQTYIEKLIHDMNFLSQHRQTGVYELLTAIINLSILACQYSLHRTRAWAQTITFSLSGEKKILKTFILSLHSPSILIIISNLVLLFLTILIIVMLKPWCDYFSIWVIGICFHCLSAPSPCVLNCMLNPVYEKTWRLCVLSSSVGAHPLLPEAGRMEGDRSPAPSPGLSWRWGWYRGGRPIFLSAADPRAYSFRGFNWGEGPVSTGPVHRASPPNTNHHRETAQSLLWFLLSQKNIELSPITGNLAS